MALLVRREVRIDADLFQATADASAARPSTLQIGPQEQSIADDAH